MCLGHERGPATHSRPPGNQDRDSTSQRFPAGQQADAAGHALPLLQ